MNVSVLELVFVSWWRELICSLLFLVICAGSDGVVVKTPQKRDKLVFNLAVASAAIGLVAVLGTAISKRR